MFKVDIDVKDFVIQTEREARQIPFAVMVALNNTMFLVREGWKAAIPKVFDRPTALTVNAVLYKKATKERLIAEVFIRDDVSGGTPPAKYLLSQAKGGARRPKPFERALARHPNTRSYYTPGKFAPRDSFGNIPSGVLGKILSQLQVRSVDPYQNETKLRRSRRLKRERKKGGKGSYFILRQDRGRLKGGTVYERITTGFGDTIRPILIGHDQAPKYRIRFDAERITRPIFDSNFQREVDASMKRALKTAR